MASVTQSLFVGPISSQGWSVSLATLGFGWHVSDQHLPLKDMLLQESFKIKQIIKEKHTDYIISFRFPSW